MMITNISQPSDIMNSIKDYYDSVGKDPVWLLGIGLKCKVQCTAVVFDQLVEVIRQVSGYLSCKKSV